MPPSVPAPLTSSRLASLRAEGLTKLFGATPALRGVSLELAAPSITFLSGANGAGKSTLLGILGTRLRPTRGKLEYRDEAGVLLDKLEVRARLGWVSHETLAYAELSGLENLRLVARLQGLDEAAVAAVRERVGLGAFAERPVGTLSRGQRQKVALARALVHQPSLLLLDEPWTGLDSRANAELERIVLEERERGTLVIIVSHEAGLAERLGAREIRLEAGRRVVDGAR